MALRGGRDRLPKSSRAARLRRRRVLADVLPPPGITWDEWVRSDGGRPLTLAEAAAWADFGEQAEKEALAALAAMFDRCGPYASAWGAERLRIRAAWLAVLGNPEWLPVSAVLGFPGEPEGSAVVVGNLARLLEDDEPLPLTMDDLRALAGVAWNKPFPPWLESLVQAVRVGAISGRRRGRPRKVERAKAS